MIGLQNPSDSNLKEIQIQKEKSSLPQIPRLISGQVSNNQLKSSQIKENNPENQQLQFSKQESINQYLENKKLPPINVQSISAKIESQKSAEKLINKNTPKNSIIKNKDVNLTEGN